MDANKKTPQNTVFNGNLTRDILQTETFNRSLRNKKAVEEFLKSKMAPKSQSTAEQLKSCCCIDARAQVFADIFLLI